ncbi:MAG: type II toxin-antitoxin system HicB family antitoxin [Phycisphaerales bacterium]
MPRVKSAKRLKKVGKAATAGKRAARRAAVNYDLPVLVELDEDGVFIVSVPSLVGCRSYGRTIEEAMRNIQEAAAMCIEAGDVPEPSQSMFIGVRHLRLAG